MHARIKELVVQSGFDTWSNTVIVDGLDITRTVENLAELIVRECMKVSMKSVGPDAEHEAWYLIKEHFGVEQ
jgi:hypothetical protein